MSNTDFQKQIEEYNSKIVETPVPYVALNELLSTFFVLFRDARFRYYVWPLIQNVISVVYNSSSFAEAQSELLKKTLSDIFSDDLIDDYAKIPYSKTE